MTCKTTPMHNTEPRKRHNSLTSNEYLPVQLSRRLSIPNLERLKKEWHHFQCAGVETLEPEKIQVDLLDMLIDIPVKHPWIRVKMGSSKYYTLPSDSPKGNWNEGFLFAVAYHTQLFDTIEFDVYDQCRKRWPKKSKHIGKSKLKLSKLNGRDNIFVTLLPIYEYRIRQSLPQEILDTLKESSLGLKKITDITIPPAKLIGSLQIRIRYSFQYPSTTVEIIRQPLCIFISGTGMDSEDKKDKKDMELDELITTHSTVTESSTTRLQEPSPTSMPVPWTSLQFSPKSSKRNSEAFHEGSQHARGELAQDEAIVNSLFINRLSTIMTSHVSGSSDRIQAHSLSTTDDKKELSSSIKLGPSPSSTQLNFQDSSPSPQKNRQCSSQVWALLQSRHSSRTHLTRGRRYGFSQHDIDESSKVTLQNNEEEKKKVAAKKSILKKGSEKTRHIIHSVNFGDKNFGSRWMQDTFEDVAMSYPLVDTFVGMVVSRQTRALVRALIKLANAFGQGFKVTGLQLLKAMLVLQKYYQLLPEPAPEPLILDRDILKDSRHYFNYALIAYGWRGLVYLGAYGQYIRGARHRRSNRMAIINYLQIPPEDLLGYEYGLRKGAAFQPSYFLAIDRSRKAIVLSIRGTWSLYDAITDLVCLYKPWKNGLVHSGMLASAQWFYTEIVPQIFRYIHLNRNYVSAFIITGHSLGGGAASLLTMMVVDHLEELRKVSCNPNFMLRCYSYAPVALSSHQLGSLYDRFIFSFICQDDIVGRLSYGTAMELKELVMDTIGAYRALGGWRKVMYDSETRKVCFDIISKRRVQIYHNAEELYPLLYIPGKIIHIVRKREVRFLGHDRPKNDQLKETSTREAVSKHIPGATKYSYSFHVGTRSLSNEMLVTAKSVEDHTISSYRNAFSQLGANTPLC